MLQKTSIQLNPNSMEATSAQLSELKSQRDKLIQTGLKTKASNLDAQSKEATLQLYRIQIDSITKEYNTVFKKYKKLIQQNQAALDKQRAYNAQKQWLINHPHPWTVDKLLQSYVVIDYNKQYLKDLVKSEDISNKPSGYYNQTISELWEYIQITIAGHAKPIYEELTPEYKFNMYQAIVYVLTEL